MKFLFLLFLFTIGSLSNYAREERVSKMPNLIILLADDLGYGELGCQGNKEIPTPHIDGIAKRRSLHSRLCHVPNCILPCWYNNWKYGTRFGHEFNPPEPRMRKRVMGFPI